ncbi:MAG TPA: hypothetical protein VK835_10280 [Bacteroidia bacterium]|jgi:hypothetical protein|nr:hypothetical protein [Bacteroidia bacterium]
MNENIDLHKEFINYLNNETGFIIQLDIVNVLHYTDNVIDEIIKLFEGENYIQVVNYTYEKYKTQDFIRIVLIKTSLDKFFFSILIDPLELFEDMWVKQFKEIDENIYLSLLKKKI